MKRKTSIPASLYSAKYFVRLRRSRKVPHTVILLHQYSSPQPVVITKLQVVHNGMLNISWTNIYLNVDI